MEATPSTSTETETVPRQKSVYTKIARPLSLFAAPFILPNKKPHKSMDFDYPMCIGQTQLPVNSRIWSSIAAKPQPYNKMTQCSETKQFNSYSSTVHNRIGVNSTLVTANSQSYNSRSYQSFEEGVGYPMMATFGPVPTPDGLIEIRLRDGIKVLITIDRGVLVINQSNNIRLAMSHNFASTALDHPNGRVFQQLQRIDLVVYDGMKHNRYVRYAKMWHKGISLTSEGCALIYLVDSAGTRTTSDSIQMNTCTDYCSQVFLTGSRVGLNYHSEAAEIVQGYRFWMQEDGTENFDINGIRVSQCPDGMVKISRSNNRCIIRASPVNGNVTITTPYYHCTASLGSTSHLFVRREERRMHFDGTSFVVRNAGHSAGFDEKNRLKVY